jgi:hypothetical protein
VHLLGAHDAHRNEWRSTLEGDADDTATPEALQLVALAEDFRGPLHTFGKDQDKGSRSEQASRILAACPHTAQPGKHGLHERRRHQPVRHAEARAHAGGVQALDGVTQQQAVVGKQTGAVGDDQARPLPRQVLEPGEIDPPVTLE